MKKILKNNIVIVSLTFLIPGILALITGNFSSTYKDLVQPKFAPPGFLFPIIWNILYILMSISAILAKNEEEDNLKIYYFQLILNALWSPIFFGLKNYLLALIELIGLIFAVIYMTYKYKKYSKASFYLLVPYIIWLLFALYLNYFVMIYN